MNRPHFEFDHSGSVCGCWAVTTCGCLWTTSTRGNHIQFHRDTSLDPAIQVHNVSATPSGIAWISGSRTNLDAKPDLCCDQSQQKQVPTTQNLANSVWVRVRTNACDSIIPQRSGSDFLIHSVVENQRRKFIGAAFTTPFMPGDRYHWTTVDGTRAKPPDDVALPSPRWKWESDWLIKRSAGCDEDGWAYGTSFRDIHTNAKVHSTSFVRHRVWQRRCCLKNRNQFWFQVALPTIPTPVKSSLHVAGAEQPSDHGGLHVHSLRATASTVWLILRDTHNGTSQLWARKGVTADVCEGSSWASIESPLDAFDSSSDQSSDEIPVTRVTHQVLANAISVFLVDALGAVYQRDGLGPDSPIGTAWTPFLHTSLDNRRVQLTIEPTASHVDVTDTHFLVTLCQDGETMVQLIPIADSVQQGSEQQTQSIPPVCSQNDGLIPTATLQALLLDPQRDIPSAVERVPKLFDLLGLDSRGFSRSRDVDSDLDDDEDGEEIMDEPLEDEDLVAEGARTTMSTDAGGVGAKGNGSDSCELGIVELAKGASDLQAVASQRDDPDMIPFNMATEEQIRQLEPSTEVYAAQRLRSCFAVNDHSAICALDAAGSLLWRSGLACPTGRFWFKANTAGTTFRSVCIQYMQPLATFSMPALRPGQYRTTIISSLRNLKTASRSQHVYNYPTLLNVPQVQETLSFDVSLARYGAMESVKVAVEVVERCFTVEAGIDLDESDGGLEAEGEDGEAVKAYLSRAKKVRSLSSARMRSVSASRAGARSDSLSRMRTMSTTSELSSSIDQSNTLTLPLKPTTIKSTQVRSLVRDPNDVCACYLFTNVQYFEVMQLVCKSAEEATMLRTLLRRIGVVVVGAKLASTSFSSSSLGVRGTFTGRSSSPSSSSMSARGNTTSPIPDSPTHALLKYRQSQRARQRIVMAAVGTKESEGSSSCLPLLWAVDDKGRVWVCNMMEHYLLNKRGDPSPLFEANCAKTVTDKSLYTLQWAYIPGAVVSSTGATCPPLTAKVIAASPQGLVWVVSEDQALYALADRETGGTFFYVSRTVVRGTKQMHTCASAPRAVWRPIELPFYQGMHHNIVQVSLAMSTAWCVSDTGKVFVRVGLSQACPMGRLWFRVECDQPVASVFVREGSVTCLTQSGLVYTRSGFSHIHVLGAHWENELGIVVGESLSGDNPELLLLQSRQRSKPKPSTSSTHDAALDGLQDALRSSICHSRNAICVLDSQGVKVGLRAPFGRVVWQAIASKHAYQQVSTDAHSNTWMVTQQGTIHTMGVSFEEKDLNCSQARDVIVHPVNASKPLKRRSSSSLDTMDCVEWTNTSLSDGGTPTPLMLTSLCTGASKPRLAELQKGYLCLGDDTMIPSQQQSTFGHAALRQLQGLTAATKDAQQLHKWGYIKWPLDVRAHVMVRTQRGYWYQGRVTGLRYAAVTMHEVYPQSHPAATSCDHSSEPTSQGDYRFYFVNVTFDGDVWVDEARLCSLSRPHPSCIRVGDAVLAPARNREEDRNDSCSPFVLAYISSIDNHTIGVTGAEPDLEPLNRFFSLSQLFVGPSKQHRPLCPPAMSNELEYTS
eukprot:m.357043 g.357043  ORF g.357043 m.357043 type:complete len:1565 (-) comp17695_c0_seq1:8589-13283(-)